METILILAHVDGGSGLGRAALEALGAAKKVADGLPGAGLVVGLIGAQAAGAAERVGSCGAARFLVAEGEELGVSRYSTDAAAAEAVAKAAGATIVVAAGTPRWSRVLPGVSHRLGGRTDTHVTDVDIADGKPIVQRWYYRQRMLAVLERASRPWTILVEPGSLPAWEGAAAPAAVERVQVSLPAGGPRTRTVGIQAPAEDQQTIRPDAEVLLVAGAGWTKKQADGATHVPEAEEQILTFLRTTKASLGGSKSLVDLSGEGHAVLKFMTHLHQIGQTGSTPRHPKGLATCCHGEEPHAVGWRFISERRAVNLDPNCGWSRGKADVVYVGDAFKVLAALNRLLAEKA